MKTIAEDQKGVRPQLRLLADAVSPEELGEEMADYLIATIPEFERSTDADFRTGTVLSCTSNLQAVWQEFRRPNPSDRFAPTYEAIAWAHELVH